MRAVTGLLEAFEQLLDLPVVALELRDRVQLRAARPDSRRLADRALPALGSPARFFGPAWGGSLRGFFGSCFRRRHGRRRPRHGNVANRSVWYSVDVRFRVDWL